MTLLCVSHSLAKECQLMSIFKFSLLLKDPVLFQTWSHAVLFVAVKTHTALKKVKASHT